MSFQDLQCRIYRDPVFNGVNMMFYTRTSEGRIYVVKPMQLELVPHDEGAIEQPTLQLNGSSAESFLKSLADALDKQGIKTDSDARIQGTLDATKLHLDDMRNLVYLFMEPKSEESL